jgi:menaquinol-cytochrome c reductase iron-sulfur subunit
MSDEEQLGRRNFMGIATWTIGGVIGLGMAVPAVIYVVGPAVKQDTSEEWIPLGPTSKVELGVPTLYKVAIERQTGWIVNKEELSVYVLTENGRDFIAMSNICTHLGCRVRWITEQEQFFCPCHNAVFDKQGDVSSGPPPRPLDRYEVKVEDGQLYILGG